MITYSNVLHSIGYDKISLINQRVDILETWFKVIWRRAVRFPEVEHMVSAVRKFLL